MKMLEKISTLNVPYVKKQLKIKVKDEAIVADHSKVVVVAKVEVEVSVDAAEDVMSLAPTTKIETVLRKLKTRQSVKNAEPATTTNSKLSLLTNQEAEEVEEAIVAEVIPLMNVPILQGVPEMTST